MDILSFPEALKLLVQAVNKKITKTNGRLEQLERKVAGQNAGLRTAIQRGSVYTTLNPLDFDDLGYDFNDYTSEAFLNVGYKTCKNCPTKTTGILTVINNFQYWFPRYSSENNIIGRNFEIWKRTKYKDDFDNTITRWTDWECLTGINSDKLSNIITGESNEITQTNVISIISAFEKYHSEYVKANIDDINNNISKLYDYSKENGTKYNYEFGRVNTDGNTLYDISDYNKRRVILLNCENEELFFVGKGSSVTVPEQYIVGIVRYDYSLEDGIVNTKYNSIISINRTENTNTYTSERNEYWKIYFKEKDDEEKNGKTLWYVDEKDGSLRLNENGVNLINSIVLDIKDPLVEYINEINLLKSNSNFVVKNTRIEDLNSFTEVGIAYNDSPYSIIGYPELEDETLAILPFRIENIDMFNNGKYIRQILTTISGDIFFRICTIDSEENTSSWNEWTLINSTKNNVPEKWLEV